MAMNETNTRQEEYINLKAFDCVCQICRKEFLGFDFPDFEYGRRIFRTENGNHMAIWDGPNDPILEEFDILLKKVAGANRTPREDAKLFDLAFGITCDRVGDERVNPSLGYICPRCGAESVDVFEIIPERLTSKKVYKVSHTDWNKKSLTEKEDELRSRLGSFLK